MHITLHREKRIALSFYPAKIMADGKELGIIDNGETKSITIPEGTAKIFIQTGPYISNAIDIENTEDGCRLKATPDISPWFFLVAAIICGAALALGVSGFKFVFVLFVFLGIDLALNRTKWKIGPTKE